jgi:hypothetical protein
MDGQRVPVLVPRLKREVRTSGFDETIKTINQNLA